MMVNLMIGLEVTGENVVVVVGGGGGGGGGGVGGGGLFGICL